MFELLVPFQKGNSFIISSLKKGAQLKFIRNLMFEDFEVLPLPDILLQINGFA